MPPLPNHLSQVDLDKSLRDSGSGHDTVLSDESRDEVWWSVVDSIASILTKQDLELRSMDLWLVDMCLPWREVLSILVLLSRLLSHSLNGVDLLGLDFLLGLERDHILLDWKIELSMWEEANELVGLGCDVEWLLHGLSQLSDLIGTHPRDDSTGLDNALSTNDDERDLAHGVCDCALGDGGDWNTLCTQLADCLSRLLCASIVDNVDNLETGVASGSRDLSRLSKDSSNGSGSAVGEDNAAVVDEVETVESDLVTLGLGPLDDDVCVLNQLGADGLEGLLAATTLLEGLGDVAKEEFGAGGKGDRVLDVGLEVIRLRLEEVHGLEDGGDIRLLEENNQGLDGGNWHGKFWVVAEELGIGLNDAETGWVSNWLVRHDCGNEAEVRGEREEM